MKSEKTKPAIFYGYVVVAATVVIFTVAWGTNRSFGVFLNPMLMEFGWSRATISGAFTLAMIVMGLAGFVAGRLTDRFDPRIVVITCTLFLGAGYFLASMIQSVWQFYVVYGVMTGIGLSLSPPLMSLVSRWFVKRRALMASIVASGPAFGNMAMPLVFSEVVYSLGWRHSFLIMSGMVTFFILSATVFIKRDPGEMGLIPFGMEEPSEGHKHLQNEGLSVSEALRTRQYWLISFIFFCDFFLMNVVTVHIVIHAMDLGIPGTQAASVLSIASGVCIFARVIIGAIGDRVGHKPTFASCLMLAVIAFAILLMAESLWMLYIFAVIFGFGLWSAGSLLTAMTADLFGLKFHGGIYGSIFISGSIGGAFGPVLIGYLYDIDGSYSIGFRVCLLIAVLSLTTLLAIKPLRKRSEPSLPGHRRPGEKPMKP